MSAFGWSWEYIDEFMTLPRYYEISEFWEDYPPMHIAFLAHAGHKPKRLEEKKNEAKKSDWSEMEELMALFGVDPSTIAVGGPPVGLRG